MQRIGNRNQGSPSSRTPGDAEQSASTTPQSTTRQNPASPERPGRHGQLPHLPLRRNLSRQGTGEPPSYAASQQPTLTAAVRDPGRYRHPCGDEIRSAQHLLREQLASTGEPPDAYGLRPRQGEVYAQLATEAASIGIHLPDYVDALGESSEMAKVIKNGERLSRGRDRAIRLGGYGVLATGVGVVISPVGHAFQNAGERLSNPPRNELGEVIRNSTVLRDVRRGLGETQLPAYEAPRNDGR